MYSFRKNNKGFTLIELMVVVMIIGVLVLLGLRAYSSQKERAMNAIVKANAGTMQTMLVGYLGDMDITTTDQPTMSIVHALGPVDSKMIENMVNPYDNTRQVYRYSVGGGGTTLFDTITAEGNVVYGQVDVLLSKTNVLYVNGRGKEGELLLLPNSLPANKY